MKKKFMWLFGVTLIFSSFSIYSMDNQPTEEEIQEFQKKQALLRQLDEKIALLEQQEFEKKKKEVNSYITQYQNLENFIKENTQKLLEESAREQENILQLLDGEKNKYTAFSQNIVNSSHQKAKELSSLQAITEEDLDEVSNTINNIRDNLEDTLQKGIQKLKNPSDNK